MKSHALLLCPTCYSLSSPLSCQIDCHSITVLVFKEPLVYLMAAKCKSSEAANTHMPERSCKVLPLSANVKVLFNKKRKQLYAEVPEIW